MDRRNLLQSVAALAMPLQSEISETSPGGELVAALLELRVDKFRLAQVDRRFLVSVTLSPLCFPVGSFQSRLFLQLANTELQHNLPEWNRVCSAVAKDRETSERTVLQTVPERVSARCS